MFQRKMNRIVCLLTAFMLLTSIWPLSAAAKDTQLEVSGVVYTFDKDAHYEISANTQSTDAPFGTLSLTGNLRESGAMGTYKMYIVIFYTVFNLALAF